MKVGFKDNTIFYFLRSDSESGKIYKYVFIYKFIKKFCIKYLGVPVKKKISY